MKRNLQRLGIFGICALTLLCGSSCSRHLFRSVDMGMTKEQVAKAEKDAGDPYIMDSGSYLYTGLSYLAMTGTVVYSFNSADETNSILFMADEAYGSTDAFNAVVSLMNKTYGDTQYQNSSYDADMGQDVTSMSWHDEKSTLNVMLIWAPDTSLTIYFVPLNGSAS